MNFAKSSKIWEPEIRRTFTLGVKSSMMKYNAKFSRMRTKSISALFGTRWALMIRTNLSKRCLGYSQSFGKLTPTIHALVMGIWKSFKVICLSIKMLSETKIACKIPNCSNFFKINNSNGKSIVTWLSNRINLSQNLLLWINQLVMSSMDLKCWTSCRINKMN